MIHLYESTLWIITLLTSNILIDYLSRRLVKPLSFTCKINAIWWRHQCDCDVTVMSHTSSCALKPNPHLSNLHHTYQNGPIKTRVVIYDVIITWSSLSTNQCLKYGSNKVTIVQIFFLRQVSITSLLHHNDVTKKPKFDSRAVNIFNWLWITFFISYSTPFATYFCTMIISSPE